MSENKSGTIAEHRIKKRAKKIRRENKDLSHMDSLNCSAQEEGFRCWQDFVQQRGNLKLTERNLEREEINGNF